MSEDSDSDEMEGQAVYCIQRSEEQYLDVDESLPDRLCKLGMFLDDFCNVEQSVGEREEAKHERGDDCEVRQRMQDDGSTSPE